MTMLLRALAPPENELSPPLPVQIEGEFAEKVKKKKSTQSLLSGNFTNSSDFDGFVMKSILSRMIGGQ